MPEFPKPRIFSSKCLGFASCRWNGVSIPDDFVESLKPYVTFITTCPEMEIGLGVPRDPIRIVLYGKDLKLMQLNTGKDVTSAMRDFTAAFLGPIGEVDGFILKDRSPSCGIKDVKVYKGMDPGGVIKKSSGFFGAEVLGRFSHLPIETEGRLTNYVLRENFIRKIFTFASFRKIKKEAGIKALVGFHAENKLLLMSYSQKELGLLGRIVANHEKKMPVTVFEEYESHLYKAFAGLSKYTSNINVMTHAFGYFSEKLTANEKKFFLNTIEEYRREQLPLSVPINLLKSYIVRFQEEYLMKQTFFEPYPPGLVRVLDSGKGRTA